jgi:hypothetical protein
MKRNMKYWLILLASSLVWTGCVSYPKPSALTPGSLDVKHRSAQAVKITVEGEPRVERRVQIRNADFAQALHTAIENSRVFTRVDNTVTQGYLLEVRITGYNPPRGGINLTATMTTHWKLTRFEDHAVVFEDFIKQQHTATVGDAFAGVTRWRKANEGVARKTIAEGIHRLSHEPL